MSTKKKLLQAAAGSAGGAGPNVEELFDTNLYLGNGSTQNVTNGIDFTNEGGMIWFKNRDSSQDHNMYDTERGAFYRLKPNNTNAQNYQTNGLNSFKTDGYTTLASGNINNSNEYHCAWSFRKQKRFFDIVQYVGDRTQNAENTLTINHNLGSTPGMIFVKCLDDAQSWAVYHRTFTTGQNCLLDFDSAVGSLNDFPVDPTSTQFTVGSDSRVNFTGRNYIAYIFAHNDGDGGFGENGDQDIIKCGSYTGGGTDLNPTINLGFEPQWLMIKRTDTTGFPFVIMDDARGLFGRGTYFDTPAIFTHTNANETIAFRGASLNGRGFGAGQNSGYVNASGGNYVYMAIRKGRMGVPEAASEVFKTQKGATGNGYAGIPEAQGLTIPRNSDMALGKRFSGSGPTYLGTSKTERVTKLIDRLGIGTSSAGGGADFGVISDDIYFGDQGGFNDSGFFGTFAVWKEAKGFFDHQNYIGNSGNVQTIYHSLGVVPEMIWFIPWLGTSTQHLVYHKDSHATTPQTKFVALDDAGSLGTNSNYLNGQAPTDEYFQVGNASETNQGTDHFSALLFASVNGVSKVGSYTGNGSIQNIDCGFTSGASLVIIKNISTGYNWNMYTQANGITSGDDPWIELDNDSAIQSADRIDAFNSGFTVNNNVTVNGNGDTYIFYAVAAH